jgi:hypothetical protein
MAAPTVTKATPRPPIAATSAAARSAATAT